MDTELDHRDGELDEWRGFASRLCDVVLHPPFAGSEVKVPPEFADAARALMFQFGRSFRTFQAIGLLLHQGYTQDALVLSRTLLEAYFDMAFIAKFPSDAKLFLEHGVNLEKRFWNKVAERDEGIHAHIARFRADELPEIAESTSGIHGSWHPKFRSVKQRAQAAGISTFDYDMLYSFLSRYVHGSGDWLRELAKPIDGGVHVSYGKDKTEAKAVLTTVCSTFLEELFILDGCLGMGIADALRNLKGEYDVADDRRLEIIQRESGFEEKPDT